MSALNTAMELNQLEQQINEAFPSANLSDGEQLAIMGSWFDENGELHEYVNLEALEYQRFFQGKSWKELVGAPLINCGAVAFSALNFLNVRACIYYLPAYILTVMHSYHENPDLVEGLFNRLTPPKSMCSSEESKNVLALVENCRDMSMEQKNSLAETFRHKEFRSFLQKNAVMGRINQDYEDFVNTLTTAQKLVIKDFILYMRDIKQTEGLAEIALKTYWNKIAS